MTLFESSPQISCHINLQQPVDRPLQVWFCSSTTCLGLDRDQYCCGLPERLYQLPCCKIKQGTTSRSLLAPWTGWLRGFSCYPIAPIICFCPSGNSHCWWGLIKKKGNYPNKFIAWWQWGKTQKAKSVSQKKLFWKKKKSCTIKAKAGPTKPHRLAKWTS